MYSFFRVSLYYTATIIPLLNCYFCTAMRKLRVCLLKDVCVPILITVWIDMRMNAANPKVENVLPGGHREPFLELRPEIIIQIDSSTIDGNVEFVYS